MSDRIRAARAERGWSQSELAERAGVSRQLIGALEAGRHSPNVEAAMRLARALGVTVEELFSGRDREEVTPVFDDRPAGAHPVLTSHVGSQLVAVPVGGVVVDGESWALADAVVDEAGITWFPEGSDGGVVVAGCDPLLGLCAGLVERRPGHRVLTVHASTARAVAALSGRRVHAAVVHGRPGEMPVPPPGTHRWHVARWQVGLASRARSSRRLPSVEELAERGTAVVQREPGAGTQQALARALERTGAGSLPGPVAGGHLDVARRVATGSGRAGVTIEPAAGAFELGFEPLEEHVVELLVDARWAALPTVTVLVEVLGGEALAARARLLRGYDLTGCGERLPAS